ncbi:hypothetical protein EQV77_11785 [Halobacillus fulvus]|nr:hypothetical protein EQV77_11785 [Halobacillus fulvus]
MTILFELMDGSYDLLFLSIYISTLTGLTLESMWSQFTNDTSAWIHERTVSFFRSEEGEVHDDRVDLPFEDLIHWLQRTVRRKEASDEGDHTSLFVY